MQSDQSAGPTFPLNEWPLVQGAGLDQLEGSTVALGELLQRYERPMLRWLIRGCRCDEPKAQELWQGFVADFVLKKRLIAQLNVSKGYQFRRFLLRALSNYVISQARKEHSEKRQPASALESLDHLLSRGELAVAQAWTPSFDVAWAQSVVAQAVARMRSECFSTDQTAIWGVFESRLKLPILEGAPVVTYQELVRRFGFVSPIQAQNALVTAKRKFARALRDVVRQYTPDETAAEVEVRELQLLLSAAGQS